MTNRLPAYGLLLIAALFLGLMAWAYPMQFAARATGETQDPREQLQQINEDKAALQQQLNELQNAQGLAHDELEDIDRDLGRLSARREQTTADLERKQAQVALLNGSHAQAVADLSKAQERFEARLVEWYKSGGGSVLGSLMTKGNLSDFLFVMSYTEVVIESDRETIDFIREQQGRLFEQKAQLDAEIAECERLLTDMRAQETEYQALYERRYTRLSEIAGDVNQAEAAMRELEASSYEIGMLLRASSYSGGGGGTGLLRPIDASITSSFGMRRHPVLGGVRMHTGVDMPAPSGTRIHAAQSGLVVFSGWKRGYGFCITIDHGGGVATLYAHCSQLLVNVGETVSRGQVIARVGTTGLSTGNHLHFEVRINGEPVDPEPYIRGG